MRRFQGVGLLCVRPPSLEPGSTSGAATPAVPSTFGYQALAQATRERSATFVAARLAAELAADATACAQAAQLFFLDLAAGHDQHVVHSHGDHVPALGGP